MTLSRLPSMATPPATIATTSAHFLAWPRYTPGNALEHLLLEFKPLLESGMVQFSLHHVPELESASASAALARASAAVLSAGARPAVVIVDVRARGFADFAAIIHTSAVGTHAPSEMHAPDQLPTIGDRYSAEALCAELGVIQPDPERAFCPRPWWHLYLDTDGSASPCCLAPLGDKTSIRDQPLSAVFNSTRMCQVRSRMLRGVRDPACKDCWAPEDRGDISFRKMALDSLAKGGTTHGSTPAQLLTSARQITQPDGSLDSADIAPLTTDIRWSNVCNFKCRMCGHDGSSAWFDDARRLSAAQAAAFPSSGSGATERRSLVLSDKAILAIDENNDVLERLAPHLSSVREVYSAGGEPLMMAEHYRYLDWLRPRASDVSLVYNTNLSRLTFKNRDVFELWGAFKSVHVGISVDGLGAVGEYVRTGFRSDAFLSNLARMRDASEQNPRIGYNLAITVSNYNVFHVPDMVRTLLARKLIRSPNNMHMNVVREPMYASPAILPRPIRERAARLYRDLIYDLASEYGSDLEAFAFPRNVANYLETAEDVAFELHRDEAWFFLNQLDSLRSTSFRGLLDHLTCFDPGHGARSNDVP